MQIGSRLIGPDQPPYIIAEIGVNHDGDLGRALVLVDEAAGCKVDAVKFQVFEARRLMSRASRLAGYQAAAGEEDPHAMLRRLELPLDKLAKCVELAHSRGLHAIATVFSLELVPDAAALPWDAFKTASPDIIHKPLLDALVATGRPLIVSTGASTLDEVERALGWLRPAHGRLALLQCVSSYPTPIDDAAIEGVGALARIFPGPVGYSDHTKQANTSLRAVLMGACLLEKHFTMDKSLTGPDHAASLEPPGMRRYVSEANRALRLRAEMPEYAGKIAALAALGRKALLDCERDVRTVSRQSICTLRPLPAGHALALADITFKRPGTGLEPFRLTQVLGRPLTRALDADVPITHADVGLS
ncbi:MAG: N-acetylneuraminate synthase family protein [Phycisphaerales bacterium]